MFSEKLMQMIKMNSKVIAPILSLLIVLALLELLVRTGFILSFVLPPPSEVFVSLFQDRIELLGGALQTLSFAALGLFLSFIVGTLLGVTLSLSRWLKEAIFPIAIFFQTVPIIAIAPVLVIWFGFGPPTVVASAFIVSIFPIIASVLLGLESTDSMLIDLFKIYSASKFQILFKLKLQSALPHIFSGLRIASGLAVIGAVVGEFIAGGGLGSVVDSARTQQRIDKVFAAVLLSSLIGLVFVSLVNYASWLSMKNWHMSEHRKD